MEQPEIPDDILKLTSHCRKNFACLKGGETCPSAPVQKGEVVALAVSFDPNCSYCLSFAESMICICPTRCYLQAKSRGQANMFYAEWVHGLEISKS